MSQLFIPGRAWIRRCAAIVLFLACPVCLAGPILVQWGSHTSGEAWLPFWGEEIVTVGRWLDYPLTRLAYGYGVRTGGLGCIVSCDAYNFHWFSDNPSAAFLQFNAYWSAFGATTVDYRIYADVMPTFFSPSGVPPDLTAPVTSATVHADPAANPGWFWSDGSVELSATDAGGAGLDAGSTLYHRPSDGSWTGYAAPITFGGEGSTSLTYLSYDRAGNVEGEHTVAFSVDLNPPAIDGVSDDPYYYGWIYDAGKVGFRVTGNVGDTLAGPGDLTFVIHPEDLTNIDDYTLAYNALSGEFTLDFFPADATEASMATFGWMDPSGRETFEEVVGIPEPATFLLAGSALCFLALIRRFA